MNVPKLRFKNAEGADFPLWTMSKLGNEVQFSKGGKLGKSDLQKEGSHQCLLYGELYTSYGSIASKIFSRTDTDSDKTSQKYDVVMPTSGETAEDIATATCIPFDGILYGGDLIILRSQTLYGPFLSYQINSSLKRKISRVAQGKSVVHIGAEKIKPISFSFPCLEEQQKIASFFSTLDQKIELNERKLEALEKLKKGVTQKILNKKIRFQKDDGTDFPDTVSCSLRDISAYSKCIVEKKNSLFIGNEQLISNFGGATLNFREAAKGNEFNSGDILFGNIRPYLKKVWLSNKSGVASPDVLIFKATNAIPGYLKFILSSERFFNHVAQGYKGSKMPRGDKHQIMDFSIQCPCLEEQQKIADFLSALDSKIDIKRKTVATMRDLKRGLMQQMFV